MYTAYIVDDEALSIEETMQTVPWLDNGLEVIGNQTDVKKAIEEIINLRPDVVFIDLRMPDMDGNEVIRILKDKADCEFIMISAYDFFDDSRRFFRQNGFDYLLKPINTDEMQLVLERLTGKLATKKGTSLPCEPETSLNSAFEAVVTYIREHYSQKITLEQLSRKFGISPGYICNLFTAKYNRTLTSYLTELRMKEAGKQILTTDKVLKQIANSCGYGNYIYFCKVFKGYYGITPTEYKSVNE